MIKPLDEVIQELEIKYSKEELLLNLNARKIVCAQYDAMMGFIEVAMKDYSFVIKNVLLFNLSISIVSHLTYNLILQLSFFLDNVENYKYALKYYLLNERFDENDDILKKFEDDKKEIDIYLQKIKDNCVYDLDTYNKDNAFDKEYLKNRLGSQKKPKFRLEKSISYLNGSDLIPCLENLLMRVKDELYTIKNGSSYEEMGFFEKIYELNYLYYAKNVWPSKREQFRSHVANDLLRGDVTVERLDREYRELSKDFCASDIGKNWENYSADKQRLAYELKRISINEEQWDFFFNSIFKMEEIARWIEELKNPPESDEDKEKRRALLSSNSIFNISKMQAKGIDILNLYRYIGKHFISDNMKAYQWYALRRFLEKLDIIDNCTNVIFKKQMNHQSWFYDAPRKCSDNEMNNYNFLKGKQPDNWSTIDIPSGSRASKLGVRNNYLAYSNLILNVNELKR